MSLAYVTKMVGGAGAPRLVVQESWASLPHAEGLTPPAQQRGIEPRSAVLETAVLPLHHCHTHTTRRWRQGGITGMVLRAMPGLEPGRSLNSHRSAGEPPKGPPAWSPFGLPQPPGDVRQAYHATGDNRVSPPTPRRACRGTGSPPTWWTHTPHSLAHPGSASGLPPPSPTPARRSGRTARR